MALGGRAALVRKIILAAIVVLLIALPLWATQGMVNVFLLIMLYMAVGEMWNLLAGYAGLVSLGQQIFIGLGGYSLAVFTEVYHLNFLLAIFIGGVVSGVFALVISQPIFKMKGIYFAIGSWIVAEAVALYFLNWGELGNPDYFKHPRQIIKYAGYDPKEDDSGSRVGRKIISKKGRWLLRKVLFFMALGVVQHSSFFRGYYEHKKKGLHYPLKKKEALCAVILKLIAVIFALMRDRRMFTEEINRCQEAA